MIRTFRPRAGDASRHVALATLWEEALADGTARLAIPDVLNLEPRLGRDLGEVQELIELAFLGKEAAKGLDRKMSETVSDGTGWNLELFARDLFVEELIRRSFTVEIDGYRFPVNHHFLYQVLSDPPTTLAGVRFRQDVFRELDAAPALRRELEQLYRELAELLAMFKSPDYTARLDINAFRLDVLKQARQVIDRMAGGFAQATSGLSRLAAAGRAIQGSPPYQILADLLEYESRLAVVDVSLGIGGSGEIKRLEIRQVRENTGNRFYRSPLGRLFERLRLFFFHGYKLDRKEIVNRLLAEVFVRLSPTLAPLVQLLGQLELYLTGLSFRRQVEARGLRTCLPRFDGAEPYTLQDVFNPLLLHQSVAPVPCSLRLAWGRGVTLITGPNSGGKTRLLQTLGLTQLLGQSGLYAPAADANLPLFHGLFVSLVETETADQAEGRLARELLRIRSLFESMGTPSLVILDELCSGTNPAEGIEVFSLVLRLLDRLEARAFISTHYLDFARELHAAPPFAALEFLQVETRDDPTTLQGWSTYQFVPGVAATSLAAVTAARLGVTFEELAALIDRRRGAPPPREG